MPSPLAAQHHDGPIDDAARGALADQGLELRLVANGDADGFRAWLQAVARGFLDGERNDEQLQAGLDRLGQRRLVGVFDAASPDPERPVATFASWVAELSVPGGLGIPSVAISSVTVAPTHRRRGILRSMMEGELRRAAELGIPVAILTVSESTIYGRFGFAPAAMSGRIRVDVPRARWAGPRPDGRVDFISRERFRELAPGLFDAVRLRTAGEIEMPDGHWDRFAGTRPDAEHPERLRAVQYTEPGGAVRGAALYAYRENHDDFARSKVGVHRLVAETADAYAALWRFLLELDLVGELTASELAVDEPLLWMIGDRRAATLTVQDHQYVRILDVPAALSGRRYAAPGVVALDVSDPIGFGEGRWLLRVGEDGAASVETWDGSDPGAPTVRLGVAELSAVYLGSVSLLTLVAAGRAEVVPVRASGDAPAPADRAPADALAAAAVFAWPETARLSFWY
ncbi:GNAT family N-acetyltransferase [Microbacterium sp. BK668]|uniref:GNAT family N-acetyltransferase n=1 Tax=Microbacterium sp. BK668 TaxID=2512118 RepID=UPI00105F07F4|nr:GNAT family N-acetyltransferase [Microbacterium sp. BK668]TDN92352.1 putative acetyltransferase [Microbacterium sp. BK668]